MWMCQNRAYMNKIHRVRERCRRVIYNAYNALIHPKNLDVLVIEMFKVYTRTSPEIMQEISPIKGTLMQI